MIYSTEFINYLFSNKQLCQYFNKELNKILEEYNSECSDYIHNKYLATSSIISKLSSYKDFLSIYSEDLKEKMYIIY